MISELHVRVFTVYLNLRYKTVINITTCTTHIHGYNVIIELKRCSCITEFHSVHMYISVVLLGLLVQGYEKYRNNNSLLHPVTVVQYTERLLLGTCGSMYTYMYTHSTVSKHEQATGHGPRRDAFDFQILNTWY